MSLLGIFYTIVEKLADGGVRMQERTQRRYAGKMTAEQAEQLQDSIDQAKEAREMAREKLEELNDEDNY